MSNSLAITGNLADDPRLFEYEQKDGTKRNLAVFRIGNSERGSDGEQYQNGFFEFVAYGPMAQNVMDSLHKGDRVVITARAQQQKYDREDGTSGYATKFVADAIGASMEFGAVTPAARKAAIPATGIVGAIATAQSKEIAEARKERISTNLAEHMTLTGLRAMAKEAGLENAQIKGLDKDELVTAINAA